MRWLETSRRRNAFGYIRGEVVSKQMEWSRKTARKEGGPLKEISARENKARQLSQDAIAELQRRKQESQNFGRGQIKVRLSNVHRLIRGGRRNLRRSVRADLNLGGDVFCGAN